MTDRAMRDPDEPRPTENDLRPGTTITAPSGSEGLSTADIAGGRRDADRDGVPDAAEQQKPLNDPSAMAAREPTGPAREQRTPLFDAGEAQGYRSRWGEVQTGFVDDPRRAVEDADGLVAEVMKKLAEGFANERSQLEQQWDRGGDVSTEDLRVALQRYRSFFDRLLSM